MKKPILRLSAAALSLFMTWCITGCVARSSGGANTQRAMAALEKEDTVSAMSYLDQALAAGEDPVMLYRAKGIALLGQDRYDEAVDALNYALANSDGRMPKTERDIRFYLATALYKTKDYDGCADICRDLLGTEKNADLYFLLGAASLAKGDRDGAMNAFDQAAAMSSGNYEMFLRIYKCYEEYNFTAIGDMYLQTALGFVAKTDEDHYQAGKIYFYLEQYEEARNALRVPVENNYTPAFNLMGEVYLKLGDYPHAQAMYQSMLNKNSEDPSAYNGLALCAIEAGDYDEAISKIEAGLSLQTEEGKQQLRFNEIVAYERKLDFSSALVKAEAYCELYPSDMEGRKELIFLRTR